MYFSLFLASIPKNPGHYTFVYTAYETYMRRLKRKRREQNCCGPWRSKNNTVVSSLGFFFLPHVSCTGYWRKCNPETMRGTDKNPKKRLLSQPNDQERGTPAREHLNNSHSVYTPQNRSCHPHSSQERPRFSSSRATGQAADTAGDIKRGPSREPEL